ncbi:MAG: hypothetical protein WCF12_09720, partial [Propionicimonas sp.]
PTEGGFTQRAYRPAPLLVPAPPALDETQLRAPLRAPLPAPEIPDLADDSGPAPKRSASRTMALAGTSVMTVLVAIGVVIALMSGQPTAGARPAPSASSEPIDPAPQLSMVPQVAGLKGSVHNGEATFVWSNPAPQAGDSYLWRPVEPGVKHAREQVKATTVTLGAAAAGRTCIEVALRRANGHSAEEPVVGCTP